MLPTFDRSRLLIKPLSERQHDLSIDCQLGLDELPPPLGKPAMESIAAVARRMAEAKERGAAILLMMGAHVIRAGVARQLIDLMERGLVTHIGMNGAGPIHDYELARIGATCESVARYIRTGEFGLWSETGEINDIVRHGALRGQGLGQAIGRHILDSDYPHKDLSILAAGVRLHVPVTVHIGIGYDILHEHPNFEPAAYGMASYRDFLTACHTVDKLEGGVFLCMGSAVMGPEVYLKALSMARNVAHQEARQIAHFTTAAFDLIPIEGDWQTEAPKTDPQYFYRPWKTILVRTVADGGESFYICGDHRQTVPHLRRAAVACDKAPAQTTAPPRPAKTAKPQAAQPSQPQPSPTQSRPSLPQPPQQASPPAPAARVADPDGAVAHYLQIKEWVQSNDAAGMETHASAERPDSHYSKISKDDYLRLFFRTVWTAGAKSQIVLTREDEYFQVIRDELYPQGRFDARREQPFLSKVASVLGGSRENRKNKAMFHTINLVESLGWEEFRRRYVAPQTRLTARLQELPMVGPKSVKTLLEQTGSGEVDAEGWVERFAIHYGFADADQCIHAIAARTGDSPMMIDFVLGSAGRKEAFSLAG